MNPGAFSATINKEVSRSHSHGPTFYSFPCCTDRDYSKKSGDYRLILDMSVNHAGAVNGAIDIADFSVTYFSFDDALALVRDAGPSPFMAKLDIKHAFRLCPLIPT